MNLKNLSLIVAATMFVSSCQLVDELKSKLLGGNKEVTEETEEVDEFATDTDESVAVEEVAVVEEAVPAAISAGTYSLSGSIGGKYPIEMEITVTANDEVYGRYRYTKTGSGDWLILSGAQGLGNTIMMYETNEKGETTGYFEGQLEGNSYIGMFTNYKGKQFSFELN